jgi:hypothetical protein
MYNISKGLFIKDEGYFMEQAINAPYKSNYTLGIIITITGLLFVIGNLLTMILPVIGCIGMLSGIISGILLLVWSYRSYKNLYAFNTQGLKFSPIFASVSWIIPVVNFVLPYLIALEMWKASDPEASTVGWKQSKMGMLVIFWWVSYFAYIFISMSSMSSAFLAAYQAGLSGMEPDLSSLALGMGIPAIIAMAVNTILEISVIVLMNDRQDEKAEKLGLLE